MAHTHSSTVALVVAALLCSEVCADGIGDASDPRPVTCWIDQGSLDRTHKEWITEYNRRNEHCRNAVYSYRCRSGYGRNTGSNGSPNYGSSCRSCQSYCSDSPTNYVISRQDDIYTAFHDRVCGDCSDTNKVFSPNTKRGGCVGACVEATNCAPSQYETKALTHHDDRKCSACPNGKFTSNRNMKECTNYSVCKPGHSVVQQPTASSDRLCKACAPQTNTEPQRIRIPVYARTTNLELYDYCPEGSLIEPDSASGKLCRRWLMTTLETNENTCYRAQHCPYGKFVDLVKPPASTSLPAFHTGLCEDCPRVVVAATSITVPVKVSESTGSVSHLDVTLNITGNNDLGRTICLEVEEATSSGNKTRVYSFCDVTLGELVTESDPGITVFTTPSPKVKTVGPISNGFRIQLFDNHRTGSTWTPKAETVALLVTMRAADNETIEWELADCKELDYAAPPQFGLRFEPAIDTEMNNFHVFINPQTAHQNESDCWVGCNEGSVHLDCMRQSCHGAVQKIMVRHWVNGTLPALAFATTRQSELALKALQPSLEFCEALRRRSSADFWRNSDVMVVKFCNVTFTFNSGLETPRLLSIPVLDDDIKDYLHTIDDFKKLLDEQDIENIEQKLDEAINSIQQQLSRVGGQLSRLQNITQATLIQTMQNGNELLNLQQQLWSDIQQVLQKQDQMLLLQRGTPPWDQWVPDTKVQDIELLDLLIDFGAFPSNCTELLKSMVKSASSSFPCTPMSSDQQKGNCPSQMMTDGVPFPTPRNTQDEVCIDLIWQGSIREDKGQYPNNDNAPTIATIVNAFASSRTEAAQQAKSLFHKFVASANRAPIINGVRSVLWRDFFQDNQGTIDALTYGSDDSHLQAMVSEFEGIVSRTQAQKYLTPPPPRGKCHYGENLVEGIALVGGAAYFGYNGWMNNKEELAQSGWKQKAKILAQSGEMKNAMKFAQQAISPITGAMKCLFSHKHKKFFRRAEPNTVTTRLEERVDIAVANFHLRSLVAQPEITQRIAINAIGDATQERYLVFQDQLLNSDLLSNAFGIFRQSMLLLRDMIPMNDLTITEQIAVVQLELLDLVDKQQRVIDYLKATDTVSNPFVNLQTGNEDELKRFLAAFQDDARKALNPTSFALPVFYLPVQRATHNGVFESLETGGVATISVEVPSPSTFPRPLLYDVPSLVIVAHGIELDDISFRISAGHSTAFNKETVWSVLKDKDEWQWDANPAEDCGVTLLDDLSKDRVLPTVYTTWKIEATGAGKQSFEWNRIEEFRLLFPARISHVTRQGCMFNASCCKVDDCKVDKLLAKELLESRFDIPTMFDIDTCRSPTTTTLATIATTTVTDSQSSALSTSTPPTVSVTTATSTSRMGTETTRSMINKHSSLSPASTASDKTGTKTGAPATTTSSQEIVSSTAVASESLVLDDPRSEANAWTSLPVVVGGTVGVLGIVAIIVAVIYMRRVHKATLTALDEHSLSLVENSGHDDSATIVDV